MNSDLSEDALVEQPAIALFKKFGYGFVNGLPLILIELKKSHCEWSNFGVRATCRRFPIWAQPFCDDGRRAKKNTKAVTSPRSP